MRTIKIFNTYWITHNADLLVQLSFFRLPVLFGLSERKISLHLIILQEISLHLI